MKKMYFCTKYSSMNEKIAILEKYNLWNSKSFDFGFKRNEYTDKIIEYTGNRLVKVLVGQRRTGKSYILRQIAKELIDRGVKAENTLLINREFSDFDFLSSYNDLNSIVLEYRKEMGVEGKIYIFIDEIQMIDEWEKAVNSFSQDYSQEYEVFITGSNSKMLSGELATLLSGRYISFEIFPFSYKEFLGVTNGVVGRESYMQYLNGGGLPELFMLGSEEIKRNYVSAVKDTVLLRDIIQRYSIREPKILEDIFIFLVNNASNLISVSKINNFFKSQGRSVSYDLIYNYIGYIEDTFIIHKCDRYDIKGRDIISGNSKYYVNDLAYKNYLYSGFGYGAGYMFENLVYLELKRNGFDVWVGVMRNKEVDFVAKKDDRLIYLQCAYMLIDKTTTDREYAPLKSINDNYEKVVMSLDDFSLPINDGIKHIRGWELREFING